MKYAGRDATDAYEPIHPPDALEKNLPPSKHLGPLKSEDVFVLSEIHKNKEKTKDEERVEAALARRPPLKKILNLADMEVRSLLRGVLSDPNPRRM
jgi:L-lactate dehydrogenase (cytochrome)